MAELTRSMQDDEKIGKPENAQKWIDEALDKKKVIMGFGHRVYRTGDSRVPTMKHYLFKVARLLNKEKYTKNLRNII